MSKKNKLVGKIGYCDNKNLPTMTDLKDGHFVYIREIEGKKCSVNVVTSLEDKDGKYDFKKLRQLRKGNIYPIPYFDANFTRWSGIGKNAIENVELSNIKNIGKKKIRKRHHFFIKKFMK